ncbi:MAG: hypothetical protein K2Q23_14290 [Bryobacteraceae bacterium]|nr:hypothetical protein [Bryobacteraceae bacterium]
MLGDLIGESRGNRQTRRVTHTTPTGFTVEVTFEDRGALLGADVVNIGTYTSTPRPDGSLMAEGQGVLRSAEGELITWKAVGTGAFRQNGAVGYRGALIYSSTAPRFERLNRVAGVFEFEVDPAGNTHGKTWEWK